MKLLGIDVGEARVGLAISDELAMTCRPYGFVLRSQAFQKIKETIEQEEIQGLVVGIPLLASGDEGSQVKDVRSFSKSLSEEIELPIDFVNEHLSSNEAEQRLRQLGEPRPKKGSIDAMSACIILESFIERNRI